jgi:hypothetical protein
MVDYNEISTINNKIDTKRAYNLNYLASKTVSTSQITLNSQRL